MIARSEAVCEDTQNTEMKAELAQHIAMAKGVAAMWNGQGGIVTLNHFIEKVKATQIPATELQSGEHKYHYLCCMHDMTLYDVVGEEPRGPVTPDHSAPVMKLVPIELECDGHEAGDEYVKLRMCSTYWRGQ